jgi:RNA polymerase sigma-70 factor (ECF subfamily)
LELVSLMRQGNRLAFNEIYERYWLKLYILAMQRLQSKDDAKDLVQDLFFSLWMKRETLVINTSLSSYLFTAIKYKVINHIESRIVKGNYLNSLNKALIDYDNSTNEKIISRDLEQFIDSGINHLSPKVKEVFELSRKENLSINEIAEKLNISDQTVKNQLSKALKILKVHLTDISASFSFFFSLYSLIG